MRKMLLALACLCLFKTLIYGGPTESCLYNVNQSLMGITNKLSSDGMICSSYHIEQAMRIASSSAYCYDEKNPVKICRLKIEAMVGAGRSVAASCGRPVFSEDSLIGLARWISGC